MGWYFDEWADRKGLIQQLTKSWSREENGKKAITICLAHTYRGFPYTGVLYSVHETRVEDLSTKEVKVDRWIGVSMLQYRRKQWGYKPMDESMGPYIYGCPMSYLEMVPEVKNAEWRALVYQYWRNRKEKSYSRNPRHIRAKCSGCGEILIPNQIAKVLGPDGVNPFKGTVLRGLCPKCGERCYSPVHLVPDRVKEAGNAS